MADATNAASFRDIRCELLAAKGVPEDLKRVADRVDLDDFIEHISCFVNRNLSNTYRLAEYLSQRETSLTYEFVRMVEGLFVFLEGRMIDEHF